MRAAGKAIAASRSRRPPTVAAVIADGLARAGTPRVFVAPPAAAAAGWTEACAAAALAAISAEDATAACLMGAATGFLADAPGAAVVATLDGGADEALAQAARDRCPLVVVTATQPSASAQGIAKACLAVAPASAAHWVAHAARLAMADPRGPVLLVVPIGVAPAPTVPAATWTRPTPPDPPDAAALEAAAAMLAGASRPLLLTGRACARGDTAAWVRALAEALPAPVLVTRAAKGVLPDPHPLHLGLFTGDAAGDPVLARADLVVALGVDADEVAAGGWPVTAPVLHVAPGGDPPLGWHPRAVVTGAIGLVIEELAPRLRDRARADWDVAELDRLKRDVTLGLAAPAHGVLSARAALHVVREATPAGTIAVIAAGPGTPDLVAAWAAVAPRELLAPAPPAVPRFALAAALAARLAWPERPLVAFVDGAGLAASGPERGTTARLGLSLVVVVVGPRAAGEPPLAGLPGWGVVSATGEAGLRAACVAALGSARPWVIDARPAPASGVA